MVRCISAIATEIKTLNFILQQPFSCNPKRLQLASGEFTVLVTYIRNSEINTTLDDILLKWETAKNHSFP